MEERVLEELAWALDSPLWTILSRRADGVPAHQAVVPSGEAESLSSWSSPMKKRKLEMDDGDGGLVQRGTYSDAAPQNTATSFFFRKVFFKASLQPQVYFLAAVRLSDLCERVHVDEKSRQRVWTLFEYVLRTETSLMAGRHLDQNLMCCLYVVARITRQEVTFHDIMSNYRHQPQACSRVYRKVLIDPTV